MPALVICVPYLVEICIPNIRAIIEILAILLPVSCFLIRYFVGKHHIYTNYCGKSLRHLQFGSFLVGILILAFIDTILVLTHIMPKGAFAIEEWAICAILFSVYFLLMVFAMYPGRTDDTNNIYVSNKTFDAELIQ